MKKILIAAATLFAASSAMAAPTPYTHTAGNTTTTPVGEPVVYTYTATAARAGYVKNDFDFTMSAWSIGKAVEPATGGAQLSVGVVSARGRGVYTGNSNGGSVSQCGTLVTAADAKDLTKVLALLGRVSVADTVANGCAP